jgi:CTP synthase
VNAKDEFPKYVVVAGGVISGVGKGVAAASIGKIFTQYGYETTALKIDPYINVDAGLLRPTEHGEVWVTEDGGEIDQDLGNYERFLNIELPKAHNLTTGQVYKAVIDRERRGEYLGQTVEFIPHIPDEIKRRIKTAAAGHEIAIVEIGGVIGDDQNIPFLFALKSLEREVGAENMAYVLITYLPVPDHMAEMKTKPTQHAIKLLTLQGIFPDFILCRASHPLDDIRKKKIETYANIDAHQVISAPDVDTIYQVPLNFEREGMGLKLLNHFRMAPKRIPDWSVWERLVDRIQSAPENVKIAMVGKYAESGDFELSDAYLSVNQALEHAGAAVGARVEISWISGTRLEEDPAIIGGLADYDGIIVPGAYGHTGAEGIIRAIRYAREHGLPFLGLCYGLQMAVIEFARHVCRLEDASSTEIDPDTQHPVVDILHTQRAVLEEGQYGGTQRNGAYAAILEPGSAVHGLYQRSCRLEEDGRRLQALRAQPDQAFRLGEIPDGVPVAFERHRHRYEVSPQYVETLTDGGLAFSGYHFRTDGTRLMEFIELADHPFFIATQAHPELKSRLERPAPLFIGFLEAALHARS